MGLEKEVEVQMKEGVEVGPEEEVEVQVKAG